MDMWDRGFVAGIEMCLNNTEKDMKATLKKKKKEIKEYDDFIRKIKIRKPARKLTKKELAIKQKQSSNNN